MKTCRVILKCSFDTDVEIKSSAPTGAAYYFIVDDSRIRFQLLRAEGAALFDEGCGTISRIIEEEEVQCLSKSKELMQKQ